MINTYSLNVLRDLLEVLPVYLWPPCALRIVNREHYLLESFLEPLYKAVILGDYFISKLDILLRLILIQHISYDKCNLALMLFFGIVSDLYLVCDSIPHLFHSFSDQIGFFYSYLFIITVLPLMIWLLPIELALARLRIPRLGLIERSPHFRLLCGVKVSESILLSHVLNVKHKLIILNVFDWKFVSSFKLENVVIHRRNATDVN